MIEQPTAEQKAMTWTELGVFTPEGINAGIAAAIITLGVYATLASGMVLASWPQQICGFIAAGWTWALFIIAAIRSQQKGKDPVTFLSIVKDDRLWGGLLGACAIFMMYYFYLPG